MNIKVARPVETGLCGAGAPRPPNAESIRKIDVQQDAGAGRFSRTVGTLLSGQTRAGARAPHEWTGIVSEDGKGQCLGIWVFSLFVGRYFPFTTNISPSVSPHLCAIW